MINKRQYTLLQLEILKPLLEYKSYFFTSGIEANKQIFYKDATPLSSFFFSISLEDFRNQRQEIQISFTPTSSALMVCFASKVKPTDIFTHLKNWENILKSYEDFPIGEEKIIKDYTDEYYAEFILVDDPSNEQPLKVSQALLLDEYLEYVEHNIAEFIDEKNETEITDIKKDIAQLRRIITRVNKSEFVKKLSVISAKMTKVGLDLIKEFLTEGKKMGIKKALGWVIENGPELIEGFINHQIKHL